ncbi:hypothetical protein LWC35_24365 [Pseudonocardia kujensis]|uniref:hypothetical protein n=1 Tax=Pseudonocardia kujensis TaxID=1128675 RepID=UPI001E65B28B|nr:hypothetical protein [Pseudonocardia kujensis]MCE0766014.1 hypothetical protein [Pseudonocardia kujensis]
MSSSTATSGSAGSRPEVFCFLNGWVVVAADDQVDLVIDVAAGGRRGGAGLLLGADRGHTGPALGLRNCGL